MLSWIKIATDMFTDNRRIKSIELINKGDTILIIWFKLMLLAGRINDGGAIYVTPDIPYTERGLADELKRPLTVVRRALETFRQYGMIEGEDGYIRLTDWEEYHGADGVDRIREQTRKRVTRCRERKSHCNATSNATNTATVTQGNAIEEEKEEEEEIEEEYISSSFEEEKEKEKEETVTQSRIVMSEEQISELKANLSAEDLRHYITVVEDCEAKGRSFTKRSHFQAIVDMAKKDGKYGRGSCSREKSYDLDEFFNAALKESYRDLAESVTQT